MSILLVWFNNFNYLNLLVLCCIFTASQAQQDAIKKADSLFTVGSYASAIVIYSNTGQLNSNLHLKIAKAHNANGNHGKAIYHYEEAIRSTNTSAVLLQNELARLYYKTKRFETADSLYTLLTDNYPTNPDFQYRLGLIKENLRDSMAMSYYLKAFYLDSTHQKSCGKIASSYLRKRAYKKVDSLISIGLNSYPDNIELISLRAQNEMLQQHYSNAILHFQRLLTLNQQNEYIHSSLGHCYNRSYQFKLAIKHYTLALSYDNQNSTYHIHLAFAHYKESKFKKAIEHYRTAIQLKRPSIDEELFQIAMMYRHQENWKDAIAHMKIYIKEAPDSHRGHYQLALFYDAYYKDPELKIKQYESYINRFKNDKNTQYFVNIAATRLEKLTEQAVEASKK
ncbi:tetratricopeptide repeat protein [Aquimarina sp. 2-A2]|uniref:tetratricopeptide repeat protein n=1 Tax=Aquimarina sp. 2-A2 TaxID=3382644 RepID=UPI00387EF5CF